LGKGRESQKNASAQNPGTLHSRKKLGFEKSDPNRDKSESVELFYKVAKTSTQFIHG
jgi:hypothetical protein